MTIAWSSFAATDLDPDKAAFEAVFAKFAARDIATSQKVLDLFVPEIAVTTPAQFPVQGRMFRTTATFFLGPVDRFVFAFEMKADVGTTGRALCGITSLETKIGESVDVDVASGAAWAVHTGVVANMRNKGMGGPGWFAFSVTLIRTSGAGSFSVRSGHGMSYYEMKENF